MAKTSTSSNASPADAAPAAAVVVSADAMALRITARKDGFRRAGVVHTATPTEWPADAFTPDQVSALLDEPMLSVEWVATFPAPAQG